MIRSMTGYGRGGAEGAGRVVNVEIKSVNSRYFDVSVKLPRLLNAYEDEIRKTVQKSASRGKIDVYINLESVASDDYVVNLNDTLAKAYFDKLRELNSKLHLMEEPPLTLVARFPDVFSVERNYGDETAEAAFAVVKSALGDALVNFSAMREREGVAVKNDMLSKKEALNANLSRVKERAPQLAAEYREKLLARMNEVLSGVQIDEARILTEAALFADKACVDEEMTRLDSHLSQLVQILEEGGAVGRKLDFLVQEMNREVNTIGSKSNDLEITKLVVEMKGDVEKIREQVQNVE